MSSTPRSPESNNHPPSLRHHKPLLNRMAPVPRVSRLALIGIGLGFAFALIAPSFVVSPGATGMPIGDVAAAVGLTVLGVVAAMVISVLAFRRNRNYAWLIIGFIPSFTILVGAAIMAASTSGS